MALPSPKEVRKCSENNGGDERKNHLFLLKESKIWKTLTLLRSEHIHTMATIVFFSWVLMQIS